MTDNADEALATADKYGYGTDSGEPYSALRILAAAYRASEQRCRGLEADAGRLMGALAQARSFVGGITNWRKGSCGTVDNVYVGQVSRQQTDELVADLDAAINSAKGGKP